jgi:hypothetical protein
MEDCTYGIKISTTLASSTSYVEGFGSSFFDFFSLFLEPIRIAMG